jgi:hypothetical protein
MMRKDKLGFVGRLCVIVVMSASAGCSMSDVNNLFGSKRTLATDDLVITTTDGQTFRGSAATIELVAPLPNGPRATASVALSTVDLYGLSLSLAFDVPPSALLDPAVSVGLFEGPGSGTLALVSSAGAEIISPGKVSLSMVQGSLEGSFETGHPTLSGGKIEGRYDIDCLVPSQMLGQEPGGSMSEGTWMLVEDEDCRSLFCRTFKGL